jgi:aryl-phospho-beta-D-glucosidase BglC (GH1 family)
MDHLVSEAGKRGLLIMLDMHRLTSQAGITDLWHMDEAFPEEKLIQAWSNIVKRSPPPPHPSTPNIASNLLACT